MGFIWLMLVIVIICGVVSWKTSDKYESWAIDTYVWSTVFLIFSLIVLSGFSLTALIINNSEDSKEASLSAERHILVYQLENNVYDNDNDLGKRELYEDITKWNRKVAKGKVMQDNIWFGFLWHDIYDQFKLILPGEYEGE